MPEETSPRGTTRLITARLALCTVLVLATSGACSYMFVDGPPEKHRQIPYFQCTTSRAWPVVDTVIGSVYAIDAVAFGVLASRSSSDSAGVDTAAAGAAAAAALFIASAISGYGKASECREATEELQLRLMRMQPGPGSGPWQPQGYPPYQPPKPYDPWVTSPAQSFGAPPPAPPLAAPQSSPDAKQAAPTSPAKPNRPPVPDHRVPEEKR